MITYIIIGSVLSSIVILSYFRSKRAKSKIINVIKENCTGCQLCIKKCRYKALEIVNNGSRRHIVLKFPEKCTACRDCIITCKFNALELIDRK
jgi:NAD-dependent dihydropyrimidine dehydrogenase PreA subunit